MTQVTSFGTPAMVRATTGSVTGSVSGLPLHAGDLLVALVTAGGSTASAAAISTPSGWTQQHVISNEATTAYAWVAVYTKVAAGSDSAPAFTATLSGTVAMTCTVLELAAAANLNPVDTYGTYASGGTAGTLTLTATTSGNVSVAGEFAIACFCMERAAATNTWTHGSGWTNAANDGTTNTVLHTAVDYYASPSARSTLAETGSWATETTAYGAGIILTVAPQLGGIELYANDASTTISSGGTDAPASGTPEFLTAASWSSFPVASNTTTPPTKFHGADPAAPSELFEILNTSTGLAVRGAQGTTPVTHSGGFTLQQVIPAGNQQTRVYNVRDPQFGAKGDGSTDDTVAFEATWCAVVASGGTMHIPPGNYKTSSTVGGNVNGMPVVIWGDPGATIEYYGSGDCIRMYDASNYATRNEQITTGIYGFLVIDGTHSSASVASTGVHAGDIFQLGMFCTVRSFVNYTGSIGVHFDNNYYWAEQLNARIFAASCGTHVMFDNSANTSGDATGSYDRMTVDVFIDQNGAGDGVTCANGAQMFDGRLGIYGNADTSTTQYAILRITGSSAGNYSVINNSMLYMGVECDDATDTPPYTIYFGSGYNTIGNCSGVLDFSGANAFTASNNASNMANFVGPVAGDSALVSALPQGTTNVADSNQVLPANAATAITSLDLPVSAYQAYRIDLYIPYLGAGTSGTCTFAFGGPTISQASLDIEVWTGTTVTAHTMNSQSATIDARAPSTSQRCIKLTGSIYWDASGTLTVTGTITSGGSTVTVDIGAYLELTPIQDP